MSNDANVERTGVATLPHGDGVHKLVFELAQLAQKVGLHKVHHCVVCRERRRRRRRRRRKRMRRTYPILAKGRRERGKEYSHSNKLFCKGVPVSMTLSLVQTRLMTMEREDFEFLITCPSSHMTRSAPGSSRSLPNSSLVPFFLMRLPRLRSSSYPMKRMPQLMAHHSSLFRHALVPISVSTKTWEGGGRGRGGRERGREGGGGRVERDGER